MMVGQLVWRPSGQMAIRPKDHWYGLKKKKKILADTAKSLKHVKPSDVGSNVQCSGGIQLGMVQDRLPA